MNFFVLCFSIIVLILPCLGQGKQDSSDTIVAIVNEEIITYGDVADKIKDILLAIENSQLSLREKEMQKQKILTHTLRALVDEKLTLQEAKRYNISISDSTVKERVEEELKDKGESSAGGEVDLREIMRARLTLQELFQKKTSYSGEEFRANIDTFVSPLEIREYYEKNQKEFTKQSKIKTRIITMFYAKHGGKEQTLAKAEDIVKKLKNGADFVEIAKQYSNDAYAKEGGNWPRIEKNGEEIWDFFGPGEALERDIEKIAFAMNENEVSQPIAHSSNPWCQVIKIEAIQRGGVTPFAVAQESIRQKLRSEKILAALLSMRMKLREKAFIWPPNLFEEN